MSVLIKGLEMPFDGSFATIIILPDGTMQTRRGDPLPYTAVPIPSHGRLIDADALKDNDDIIHKYMLFGGQVVYSQGAIDNAPTIIEAEGKE